MKKLLLSIALLAVMLIPQANGVTAVYLDGIRAEIVAQQIIVSNTVPLNKPVATALRAALTKIDKTAPSNVLAATKTLTALATTLSKSSLSNAFGPFFDSALNNFLGSLYGAANIASNRIASTFPSGPHTAAQNKLNLLLSQIAAADANGNLIAAAKLIGQAAKTYIVTSSLITKAENVPPPKAGVTATVSGASSFAYKSTLAAAIAVNSGNGLINSAQAVLKAPYGQRGVLISLAGVNSGANTLAINNHVSGLSSVLVTEVYGNGAHASYESTTGTLNVNYNPATKALVGTFTATCVDGANTITITGSFSATTL